VTIPTTKSVNLFGLGIAHKNNIAAIIHKITPAICWNRFSIFIFSSFIFHDLHRTAVSADSTGGIPYAATDRVRSSLAPSK